MGVYGLSLCECNVSICANTFIVRVCVSLSVATHLSMRDSTIMGLPPPPSPPLQVKELYQGVQANLQSLQPGWSAALGRLQEGEAHQRLQRELEREVGRRRTLAQQTRALLESQLQVLRSGLQAQRKAQQGFTARLRESLRLLGWSRSTVPVWDQHSPQ